MCHIITAMWCWARLVCAVVNAAGTHLAVSDVAICCGGGGGLSVLVWGGGCDGGHW
jgi:hypothetical protein